MKVESRARPVIRLKVVNVGVPHYARPTIQGLKVTNSGDLPIVQVYWAIGTGVRDTVEHTLVISTVKLSEAVLYIAGRVYTKHVTVNIQSLTLAELDVETYI